jgi:hypothetical protein
MFLFGLIGWLRRRIQSFRKYREQVRPRFFRPCFADRPEGRATGMSIIMTQ